MARSTDGARRRVKKVLALGGAVGAPSGATLLIYHRVGGGTRDELDLTPENLRAQLDILDGHDVLALDAALDRLDAGDDRPSIVLTFDDGFEDVFVNAWPLLKERRLPFTIYLTPGYIGRAMVWEGSTAGGVPGRGLSWDALAEMLDSGLLTIGNHTFSHVTPDRLSPAELDHCDEAIVAHLGVRPRHFTYPWGIAVPAMEDALRARFRSASTGELGRNLPGGDLMRLRRVPVRRTDPLSFFRAKVMGGLGPERAYASLVGMAKRGGLSA